MKLGISSPKCDYGQPSCQKMMKMNLSTFNICFSLTYPSQTLKGREALANCGLESHFALSLHFGAPLGTQTLSGMSFSDSAAFALAQGYQSKACGGAHLHL